MLIAVHTDLHMYEPQKFLKAKNPNQMGFATFWIIYVVGRTNSQCLYYVLPHKMLQTKEA